MSTSRKYVAAVLGVALAALTACGDAPEPAATNAPPPPANRNAAPAPPAPEAPAAKLDAAALERTAKLFDATCATCHLRSGRGDRHHASDGIPDFTDRTWHAARTDDELRATIVNGSGAAMPAFGGRLSDERIDELIAYVRGFPDRAAASGPAKAGASKSAAPGAGAARKPAGPAAPAPKRDGGHGDHPH